MSQQTTLPVTLPPALGQQPLESASPPADTQQEQAKQPTLLPGPCQKVPSELPGEVPLVHREKHAAPVKGVPEQDGEPQQQEAHLEQHLEQQQQQQQQQREDHQETESPEQPLEEELGENEQLSHQQLDRELAKGDEPLEQREGPPEPPALLLAPGQVQETRPVQPLQGEVEPPAEQQQQKREVQWPPKHK